MCEKLPLQNVENNKQNKISIFIAKKIEIRKIKKIGQMCAMIMKGCVSKENNVSLKSGISYILARLMRDFCDFKINFISYFILKDVILQKYRFFFFGLPKSKDILFLSLILRNFCILHFRRFFDGLFLDCLSNSQCSKIKYFQSKNILK